MPSIRRLLFVVVGLHGLVHILGFVVAWKLATVHAMPYSTAVLGGDVALGSTGVRALGVVWLLLAVLFTVSAFGIWRRAEWERWLLTTAASVSVVACVLELNTTYAGLVIDLLILAWLWSSRERLDRAQPAS